MEHDGCSFIAILQQSKYYDEANTLFWRPKRCKVFKKNLTSCNSFYFEIWQVVKFLTQNDAFRKAWKVWKKYDFHGAKGTETWFFERLFFGKSVMLKNFYFKVWRVVKISLQKLTRFFWIQNLTLCTVFVSKTGRTKSPIQKLTRGEVFDPKLIFCSSSGCSMKQLKERINKRSSQFVFAWDLVKPV